MLVWGNFAVWKEVSAVVCCTNHSRRLLRWQGYMRACLYARSNLPYIYMHLQGGFEASTRNTHTTWSLPPRETNVVVEQEEFVERGGVEGEVARLTLSEPKHPKHVLAF